MADDWWYTESSRSGSGVRAAAVNAMSFTMWPRNAGSSKPSMLSVACVRGFANWPAMRPTFSAGTPEE